MADNPEKSGDEVAKDPSEVEGNVTEENENSESKPEETENSEQTPEENGQKDDEDVKESDEIDLESAGPVKMDLDALKKTSFSITFSTEVKLLKDLKVTDLKAELEKRGLATSGVKVVLAQRLKKHLVSEGFDVNTYDFNQRQVDEDADKTVDVNLTENSEDLDKQQEVSETVSEETKDEEEPSKKDDEEDQKDEKEDTEKPNEDDDDDGNEEEKGEEVPDDGPDVESDRKVAVKLTKINDSLAQTLVLTIDNKKEEQKDEDEKMDTIDEEVTGKPVTGVVFQFNSKVVLFEFTIPVFDKDNGESKDEEFIGEIKVETLKLNSKGKSIPDNVTDDEIGSHIQAGDELKCYVVEKDDLEAFTYEEEEEEVGENGDVNKKSKEVKIHPKWSATKGHVITEEESSKKNLKEDEVLALNDQLEDMFDYEPEEEDEDMLLIEDVQIDDENESGKNKTKSKAADDDDDLEIVGEVVSKKTAKKPAPKSKKEQPAKEESKEPEEVEELYVQKARLVQLRKPSSATSGAAMSDQKPDVGKVTSCILELLDGKHAGKQLNAVCASMYMWGYNLAKANLNSTIKVGDHCQVEYKVQPKKENHEFSDDLLVVKKTWIGPKTEKPLRPSNDKNFSVYLSGRSMNETDFLKWVYGQSTNKPYFPFASDIYEGELQSYVRDSSTGEMLGVVLHNVKKQWNFNATGGYVKAIDSDENSNEVIEEDKETAPETEEEELKPPGMEEDNISAEEVKAYSAMRPPAEESSWTPLHYLQDANISKTRIAFEEDKIRCLTKNMAFSFHEMTNFQASDKPSTSSDDDKTWSSSGPFYSVGTLAYLMQCKGIKYAAYIQRTLALAHVQYVKKQDVQAVFDYLTGKCNTAPLNVRDMDEMKEKKNEANSDFFNDRSNYVDEDGYVIPSDDVQKIDSVMAFTTDFYIGGVSISKCDLRLFLGLGDKVSFQISDMSSAEKRKLKKRFGPDAPEKIPEYMATLAFFASEKRPKSAIIQPIASLELKDYLSKTGWALEEFAALRQFGMRPPQQLQAESLTELVGQNEFPNATRLAKEAMKIPTLDGNDVFINKILRDDDDIRVAVWMSKIITKALTNKLQANLKAKISDTFFNNPTNQIEINNQVSKIAAAETALISKDSNLKTLAAKNGVDVRKSAEPVTSGVKPLSQLKELEEQERKKAEANFEKITKKSTAPKRDAKALLKSYKETTGNAVKEPPKKMYTLMSDLRKGLPQNKDEWTPLEYLRHFSIENKEIKTDFNHVIFGPVKFFKSTKCNFRNNKDDSYPWYTLEQLYVCYKYRELKHGTYLEELRKKFGPRISRDLFLYHRDRDALLKYLGGGSTPEQVVRRTRRELNPEHFNEHSERKRTRSRSRSPSHDDLERERKAQLQLQILQQQHNTAKPTVVIGPDGRPSVEMVHSAPPKQRSRFDLAVHPSQLSQPGVVLADHRPSKPNPYEDSRSNSNPYSRPPPSVPREDDRRNTGYRSERSRSPMVYRYDESGNRQYGDRHGGSSGRDRDRDRDRDQDRDRRPYERYDQPPPRRPSPPRNQPPPYGRGISPPRMDYGRGISPPRMDPGRGISPPRLNYGRGISPPRMDSTRGVVLMDQMRNSRSPPRYGGPPPPQQQRSPPRRSKSPGLGYFLNLSQPKPKQTVESDLEKYWRDQMSTIGGKPPNQGPTRESNYAASARPQRSFDDEYERMAQAEAMAEQRRLMAAAQNQEPDVVELSDSDDEGPRPSGPPKPPMISQPYGMSSGNPLQRALDNHQRNQPPPASFGHYGNSGGQGYQGGYRY